ncbi:hypothetical protein D3C77_267320 [compost metagenome]
MAKENSPWPSAARCWRPVRASRPPVALTTSASRAEAIPNRSTTDTTGSTAPSWKVMAYQVVPQIRAQTPTPPKASMAGDERREADWDTQATRSKRNGNFR